MSKDTPAEEVNKAELRLVKWLKAGFPPIDFRYETEAIVELIKAYMVISSPPDAGKEQEAVDNWWDTVIAMVQDKEYHDVKAQLKMFFHLTKK